MRDRLRNEHNLSSKKVILFAGRLSPNKGIDVLVRAIPELARKHDDIALVIMGSKWFSDNAVTDYIAYVRALAERLPIPVVLTGFVSPDKIQEWFAASDIFVCTSQWQEPLARVHYEAMAAALPIVTTNRGGNTEVIEPYKNGVIVENPEDTGEFVKHISYLLSNPEIGAQMGRYGRSLAEKYYSWDRVVQDISSVWDQVEHAEEYSVEPGLEANKESCLTPEQIVTEAANTIEDDVKLESAGELQLPANDESSLNTEQTVAEVYNMPESEELESAGELQVSANNESSLNTEQTVAEVYNTPEREELESAEELQVPVNNENSLNTEQIVAEVANTMEDEVKLEPADELQVSANDEVQSESKREKDLNRLKDICLLLLLYYLQEKRRI
nr:glycosyltransferase family 4 protein [Halobacillus sp. A1]